MNVSEPTFIVSITLREGVHSKFVNYIRLSFTLPRPLSSSLILLLLLLLLLLQPLQQQIYTMSCLTSSVVESCLQQFSQLISSGRLTPYENEVALVLWQYELRRLRRWAAEAEWFSLYRLWEAPGIEDSSYTSYVD
jgi:hypothetical protein